jgi:chaperonin GroES
MTKMIEPLGMFVVIEPIEKEDEITASGLIVPETVDAAVKPLIGTVLAVGEGEWDGGRMRTVKVKVGDTVLYNKYSGDDYSVKKDGKTKTFKIIHGDSLTCRLR